MAKSRFLWLIIVLLLCAAVQAGNPPEGIPPAYQLVAENEGFQLYVDSSTLAFKLLDKGNNYIWHSGLDELAEGDRLNRSWQAFALSGISIEYYDNRATNARASITNSNHTLEVTNIEQGIAANLSFLDYGISLSMSLQLEAEGLKVEILSASIREENPDFRLAKVYVYPFFGATRGSSISGYMFLPDGIGSIVRFADETSAQNIFYGRYYGADLGMISSIPYDDFVTLAYPISFPVFGMTHGEAQNAFLMVVENGASYAEVQMHPAGIITNFNFIFNAFIYNEAYFQATNKSGAGVTTVQRQINSFDVLMHYRFLRDEAADYVGMAQSYQAYLLEKGLLGTNSDANPNMGIRLEFLGGDKERVLFWDNFVSMTTISQINTILDELQMPYAEVVYYGWQPLGATALPPRSLQVEGQLGSLGDLNALADRVVADGGHFSLYLDPQAATVGESGYSVQNDLAISITDSTLFSFNRLPRLHFNLPSLQERYTALSSDIAANSSAGLALDGIGSMLYSDFRDDAVLNREAAIAAYQNLLAQSNMRLNFYRPNDYLFGLTDAYFDMPLGDNGYVFTSEAVPFLPIVLSGHIPYYGVALNFSANLEADILKHIEYGIYPSYFLTHEPTANMINTRSAFTIYTSSFAQWGDEIRNSYEQMSAVLSPVRGQEIIAHGRLANGVSATTYANGMQVIVNYNNSPFTLGDRVLEARTAALLENAQ